MCCWCDRCSRFGCDLCGVAVQPGVSLRGCRLCDYDVCSECSTNFTAADHGESVLNRTLGRTSTYKQHQSLSGRAEPSFFEAARGLNTEGHTDSDEDVDSDEAQMTESTGSREMAVEMELRYDHIKGRYVKVERPTNRSRGVRSPGT